MSVSTLSVPTLSVRDRAILGVGAAVSLLAWLAMRPWDFQGWMIGAPLGRDYVNFWLAPRLVLAGQGAMLTDLPAYAETVMGLFGLRRDPMLLFSYPPHTLFLLAPFSALPFIPAVLVWTAVNLACLALATRLVIRRTLGGAMLWAVCLSPSAVAMMMYGHFGGILALAATLVLFEAERRPVVAGIGLAVLSVKPQFACALGVMLLGAGYWRCLLAGAAVTFVLVALSAATFGVAVWQGSSPSRCRSKAPSSPPSTRR